MSKGRWDKYGLRDEMYYKLHDSANGRCYICKKRPRRGVSLCIDHDHTYGMVRGLICSPCNQIIGWLHEDADRLANMAEYLRNPPAVDVIGKVYVPGSYGAWKGQHG